MKTAGQIYTLRFEFLQNVDENKYVLRKTKILCGTQTIFEYGFWERGRFLLSLKPCENSDGLLILLIGAPSSMVLALFSRLLPKEFGCLPVSTNHSTIPFKNTWRNLIEKYFTRNKRFFASKKKLQSLPCIQNLRMQFYKLWNGTSFVTAARTFCGHFISPAWQNQDPTL